ncbi:hypothetical protein BJX68DRAFT_198876 [Aspergillus pseudodeflectus]|uniref:Uncharacterized protein n=1 Tax=Aspergillus pseudodeflectus TaxID=176178 RepID=A0ABR4JK20_9EURO
MGVLVCPPSGVRLSQLQSKPKTKENSRNWTAALAIHTIGLADPKHPPALLLRKRLLLLPAGHCQRNDIQHPRTLAIQLTALDRPARARLVIPPRYRNGHLGRRLRVLAIVLPLACGNKIE